ncbi:MAG: UPF0175 family protein [Cyclobacteriaceae bacterium]|nr:UPF0175 family protein [Cyclobacteriaceae bacterium]
MKKLSLTIPDNLQFSELELEIILAGGLYKHKKLTLDEAADLINLSKSTFVELIKKHGFSLLEETN